jgi:hypothetical protein
VPAGRKPRRAEARPTTIDSQLAPIQTMPACASAGNGEDRAAPARSTGRVRESGKILPSLPDSEAPAAWGDADHSNDSRLLRERPPHW